MTMEMVVDSKIDLSVLKFSIARKWNVIDFCDLLGSVEQLHRIISFLEDYYQDFKLRHLFSEPNEHLKDYLLDQIICERPATIVERRRQNIATASVSVDLSTPAYEVVVPGVVSIEYSSPGKIEILGLGKVFSELRRYLEHRDFLRENKGLKQEQLVQAQINTQMQRIKLYQSTVKTLRDIGFPDEKIREILLLEFSAGSKIVNLLDQTKLERIEQRDVEPELEA
jgi:hypothetical protein